MVYTGGVSGLYPTEDPLKVHLKPVEVSSRTYFLVSPTDLSVGPAAVLIQPKPGGQFETMCAYEAQLNY